MKINEMTALLSGEARTAAAHADAEITSAYAGDMLSDVLALGSQPDVLLTGLLNPQVIRTAEMLDTACVVFLRGKEPEASILELAEKCGVCVLTSPLEMYDACGILHQHGGTWAKGARSSVSMRFPATILPVPEKPPGISNPC